jgi:hypothetical protein
MPITAIVFIFLFNKSNIFLNIDKLLFDLFLFSSNFSILLFSTLSFVFDEIFCQRFDNHAGRIE